MKHLSCLGALVILTFAPAVALAEGPPPPPPGPHGAHHGAGMLASAAHDLTDAAEALSRILASRGPSEHVYQDALTLFDAAEHFEEEVMLGPEDLDVDFQAIEDTFDEMRDEFRTSPCVQKDDEARSAWFQISEANLRLRTSWFAHYPNRFLPPRVPSFPHHPEEGPPPPPSYPYPAEGPHPLPAYPGEGPHPLPS